MTSKPRTDHCGAFNHVTHHGANHYDVFVDDLDRYCFLLLLAQMTDKYDVKVVTYCLMGNHFHLLVYSADDGAMARGMQWLLAVYTKRFNRRHRRTGALLRGRYRSFPIDSDGYLLWCSRYIHINPVKDGFTERPEDWMWSSYAAYVNDTPIPRWLSPEAVFELKARGRGYRLFTAKHESMRPTHDQITPAFGDWLDQMQPELLVGRGPLAA